MRTAIRCLAAIPGLAIVACTTGGVTVVRPVPAPTPAPVVYVEPLEMDIARPHHGKMFVQTNRAAYVAIFEIIPERGVELVYPVSSRDRRYVVAGLRTVPVWWEGSRTTYHAGWSTSRAYPGRYIYALASDEPLRIPDAAYQPGYLRNMLGAQVYWSANPYATMRALQREFVPAVREEEWAEDMYVLSPTYATESYRVTRVYCRGGSVIEVPSELADHVWCPTYVRGEPNDRGRVTEADLPGSRRPMARPDSVVGDNGRRVAMRVRGANGRGPIYRVKEPPVPEQRGNDRTADNNDRPGNGPPQRPAVGPDRNRRVVPNERTDDPPPRRRVAITDDRDPPKPNVGRESKRDENGEPKRDGKDDSRPDADRESKPDTKRESKPDANDDSRRNAFGESKRDAKGESKPDASDDSKPKANDDSKPKGNDDSKRNANDDSKPGASGETKPQQSDEARSEPTKGRGRPEAKDDKQNDKKDDKKDDKKADDKAKDPRGQKPLG